MASSPEVMSLQGGQVQEERRTRQRRRAATTGLTFEVTNVQPLKGEHPDARAVSIRMSIYGEEAGETVLVLTDIVAGALLRVGGRYEIREAEREPS